MRGLPARLGPRLAHIREVAVLRAAHRLGYDTVRSGFYSPLPDLAALGPDTWTRASPLEGIDWDSGAQLAWVEENLTGPLAEWDPAFDTGSSYGRYDVRNGAYDEIDSELAWAMVRFLRPRRLVELGSGASSLVLAHAARANAADGSPCEYRVFDPFPRPWVEEGMPGMTACEPVRAQDVPLGVFEALEAGDVLFVDTTHTVKTGSEVNRIVLDVLPRLAPGVAVHFHDIFLPWEYHRHWIEGDFKWNEQYLLQAFLSMNSGYEVLCSSQALVREQNEGIRSLVSTIRPASAPSALWIRARPR